jgi:hypothetical protein
VFSIAASPDQTILCLGGSFTRVNGVIRNRIAAVHRATGKLIDTFQPKPDTTVRAIVATSKTVYFGGLLGAVSGVTRPRLAAGLASDGKLLSRAPVAARPKCPGHGTLTGRIDLPIPRLRSRSDGQRDTIRHRGDRRLDNRNPVAVRIGGPRRPSQQCGITFGVHPGTSRTLTSPTAYNNNQWHHVVATLGSAGMAHWLDGTLVGSQG